MKNGFFALLLALLVMMMATTTIEAAEIHKAKPQSGRSALIADTSKYAYVTLLCDPMEEDQAEYVRMLLVLQESIRQFDKENDIVTMVYGGINEEQWELLDEEGFKIIQVDDVGAMVSDPEPLRVPDSVSACYRSKLNALQLTQYEKVVFLDNDMLVKQDLQFMFQEDGFFAYEGVESPLNTGLFVVDPSNEAFAHIEEIIMSDSFHPEDGWLGYGAFPHWKLEGHMSDWSFWCAHTDQGILYYYYDKVTKTATILPKEDATEIVHHFTGWNKPVLHDHEEVSEAGLRTEDTYSEWYKMWDRVQSRLEETGKDYPFITSTPEAVVSRVRRVLNGANPY